MQHQAAEYAPTFEFSAQMERNTVYGIVGAQD